MSISGNGSGKVPAEITSPWNWAGISNGEPNVLVVGSHDPQKARSSFSNQGQEIEAPGELILSTVTGGHGIACGTSMAAPFISGLAGYLLEIDGSLTPAELKQVILAAGPHADAFTSALEIDALEGKGREVLKMLIDIDDGSLDGNERVAVPIPDLRIDRDFDPVVGADNLDQDLDGDGGVGDGDIDMSDFRRWRDWYLFAQDQRSLNGSGAHPKNDANGDGRIDRATEIELYPRGDFNGDGIMSLEERVTVAGELKVALTDLEVIAASDLWSDPVYSVAELEGLVDSVDIVVSARSLFYKYNDFSEVLVAPYDAVTGEPIPGWQGRRVILTAIQPEWIITVPVGVTCFIASDPIELEDETKIVARSISEAPLPLEARGADLAVDLVRIEMSALAETLNPDLDEVDSEPLEKEVDALIGAEGDGERLEAITYGARGWANEEATLYTVARAGQLEVPPDDPSAGTTFESTVRWQRSFRKIAGKGEPEFDVKPMELRIVPGIAPFEFSAFAEISLEMRSYDLSPTWQPVFFYRAEIAGRATASGHTFRIVGQEGDLEPVPLTLIDDGGGQPDGAEYVQIPYKDTISLEGIGNGHSFEVRYTLTSRVFALTVDSVAEAYVGDPLVYASGIRMSYGGFGELPRVDDVTAAPGGGAAVSFVAKSGFYYILYRGDLAVAVLAGEEGQTEILDAGGTTADEYILENQPVERPLDLDDDGIDDLYELAHPDVLDPLDPDDARLDPDGDGRSSRLEYEQGTDPAVPDSPPVESDALFPALVFDPGVTNARVDDVDGDGITDLIGVGADSIVVALGLGGGGFEPPLESETSETNFLSESETADVNGDGFLDVLIANIPANRVEVLIGDGSGGFASAGTLATGTSPERIIAADVNGDGFLDVLTANTVGRSISVLLGNGDGTFGTAGDVPIALGARPRAIATADMDADGAADLIVAVQQGALTSIFPGNGDGTFGLQRDFAGGFDVREVAAGDLNGDGHPDVVTSNGTGNVVSVFLGNGDGTLQPRTDYPTGRIPAGFRLADLDEDGDLDLVVGHHSDNHHAVLLNDGSGAFTEAPRAYTGSDGTCLLADLDGDGVLDLLSRASQGYFVSEGLGGGLFNTRAEFTVDGMYATRFRLADVDADGSLDVLLPDRNAHAVQILGGSPGGSFSHAATVPVGKTLVDLVVAPFDGDGVLDIAAITERPDFLPGDSRNALHILLADGGGGFEAGDPIDLPSQPTQILAGDIDGDGSEDLVVKLSSVNSIVSYRSQGDGTFVGGNVLDLGVPLGTSGLVDLDGDGRADFVTSTGGSGVLVLLADAAGELIERPGAVSPESGNVSSIVLHDMTDDGILDIVGTTPVPGSLRLLVLPGLGDGTFGAAETLIEEYGGDLLYLSIVDIDGDGRPDINGGYTFLLALEGGGFDDPRTHFSATQAVRDVNGDGKPDRLAVNGDALEVLFQR